MLIHTMLSDEWENWGNPRRYQRQEADKKLERDGEPAKKEPPQLPPFLIRRDSVGMTEVADELFGEEVCPDGRGGHGYWSPSLVKPRPRDPGKSS